MVPNECFTVEYQRQLHGIIKRWYINSVNDPRLLLVDPTKNGFFDKVIEFESFDKRIQEFIENVKLVKQGVDNGKLFPFYKPIMDPTFVFKEANDESTYEAVLKCFRKWLSKVSHWEQYWYGMDWIPFEEGFDKPREDLAIIPRDIAISFLPYRHPACDLPLLFFENRITEYRGQLQLYSPLKNGYKWRIGSLFHYYAFLVYLINSLVEDTKWYLYKSKEIYQYSGNIELAIHDVVIDSRRIGHYANTPDLKWTPCSTLRRPNTLISSGGPLEWLFSDLAGTRKALVGDLWEDERICFASGCFHDLSHERPLASFNYEDKYIRERGVKLYSPRATLYAYESVPWLIVE